MDVEQRARGADEYELSLADSLRQLAEAEWTLNAELMPDDARQVLFNAAGLLAFNHHHVEAGLATIRLQSDFIKAMGDAMRGVGCEFDPEECKVVNTLADRLRMESAHPEGHVVVTRNEAGQAVAVTRQDDEGRILSVIAEFEQPERSDQSLLELAAVFDTCIPLLPPAGQRNIGKAVAQLRHMAMGYVLVPVKLVAAINDLASIYEAGGDIDRKLWEVEDLLDASSGVKP